ncbi:hypothetical protein [Bacillus sp. BR3(2024)]|uniref:hypothetical protein n=1 Tax=Bacillus sp. BR3(2024) TaxID=3126755 RepID=UPI003183DB3E
MNQFFYNYPYFYNTPRQPTIYRLSSPMKYVFINKIFEEIRDTSCIKWEQQNDFCYTKVISYIPYKTKEVCEPGVPHKVKYPCKQKRITNLYGEIEVYLPESLSNNPVINQCLSSSVSAATKRFEEVVGGNISKETIIQADREVEKLFREQVYFCLKKTSMSEIDIDIFWNGAKINASAYGTLKQDWTEMV